MTRLKGFLPSMHTLAALALFALVCTATAVAAGSIDGADIKKKTITNKALAKATIKENRLSQAIRTKLANAGTAGPRGPAGPAGPGGTAEYTGPKWGIIDRNTIGSAVGDLRSGPYVLPAATGTPPFGVGSLGLQVSNKATSDPSDPAEKIAFGNEVDFQGNPFLSLTQVGFRAFQTGENNGDGTANLTPTNVPNITIEIDPNLTSTSSNFSSAVWNPGPLTSNQWSVYKDATTVGTWMLTGAAGVQTGCNQSTPCNFTQLKTLLNDAGGGDPTISTVAIGKGRDFTYAGAVDGLRINNVVYDFEPFGVVERAP